MPQTAKSHFNDDIKRAFEIFENGRRALAQGQSILGGDLMLSAVAMSVGAMDAYLCDAYVDCISVALRSYYLQSWPGSFPARYKKQMLPAGEVLNSTRANRPLWSIRMAARKIMERENMLSISKFDELFNPILPNGKKLWNELMPSLMKHNRKRFTRHTAKSWPNVPPAQKEKQLDKSINTFKTRIGSIVQIRHDWIHNCGRPKSAIKHLTRLQAFSAIRDIKIFIDELDAHIDANRIV